MKRWCVIGGVLGLTTGAMAGDVIGFESINGETPTDGMTISDQFAAEFGVVFSLEGGGHPVLAQVGAPQTAFQGYQLLPDQPAPDAGVGAFFLTDDGDVFGPPPPPLIIDYLTPVSAASGVVLDVDGMEMWSFEAYDAADQLLASTTVLPNNMLDGSAQSWSFSFETPVIERIVMRYTGRPPSPVGLAFDNFSPASVASCLGDLNSDGAVDSADLAILLGAWGTPSAADLDQSGDVDAADLALLLGAWGPCEG